MSSCVYTSGQTNIGVGGRTTEIVEESFVVFDLSQPIVLETMGMTGLISAVPRRYFEDRIGDVSAWHGQVVPSVSSPITKLIVDHVRNVSLCLRKASPAQMSHIIPATIALGNCMVLSELDSAYNRQAVTGIAIQQFIEEQLTRVDAEMAMTRFGTSRTPLYSLEDASLSRPSISPDSQPGPKFFIAAADRLCAKAIDDR